MNPKLDAILGQPWALQPSVLRQIAAFLSGDTSVRAAISRPPSQPRQAQGYVQVIPIHGVIERRSSFLMDLFGGSSIEGIRGQFRAAIADPDVRGIVLDIDSPGGSVAGVTELAKEIRDARGAKPIYALADTMAGSAAYWLGAQAEQLFVTPSGEVGSVGVYGVHMDISRALDAEGVTPTIVSAGPRKTAESELEPLTDEARAAIQARVDSFYDSFVADVAKGRNTTTERVKADYGEGASLLSKDALAAGMVDGIETLDGVLRLMTRAARRTGTAAAEGEGVSPLAAIGQEHDGIDELSDPLPFRQRVIHLESDARAIVEHGQIRAALRAKEGRPAFSEATLTALRSTRDALSALLADEPPVEPTPAVDPPKPPVQPAPVVPVATAAAPRFRSQDEWLQYLTERKPA